MSPALDRGGWNGPDTGAIERHRPRSHPYADLRAAPSIEDWMDLDSVQHHPSTTGRLRAAGWLRPSQSTIGSNARVPQRGEQDPPNSRRRAGRRGEQQERGARRRVVRALKPPAAVDRGREPTVAGAPPASTPPLSPIPESVFHIWARHRPAPTPPALPDIRLPARSVLGRHRLAAAAFPPHPDTNSAPSTNAHTHPTTGWVAPHQSEPNDPPPGQGAKPPATATAPRPHQRLSDDGVLRPVERAVGRSPSLDRLPRRRRKSSGRLR